MNKRAVQMAMSVIITAVIILLIAVVLIFIFQSGIGPFAKFTESCEEKGGSCSGSPCNEIGGQSLPYTKSCEESGAGSYCCYFGIRNEP